MTPRDAIEGHFKIIDPGVESHNKSSYPTAGITCQSLFYYDVNQVKKSEIFVKFKTF